MNRKNQIESKINDFYENQAKGAQIRSKSKWVIEGEKTQTFFFHLKNAINKII